MRRAVRPGPTTAELDAVGAGVFARHGARSAAQLAYDFRGTNCISLNDEAVHGVPSEATVIKHDLLTPGLVLAVEPIIAAGIGRVGPAKSDGWTLPTRDGSLSAHVEHTVVVTAGSPLVLTRL